MPILLEKYSWIEKPSHLPKPIVPQSEPESDPESDPESEPESDPESDPDPEPDPEPEQGEVWGVSSRTHWDDRARPPLNALR